MINGNASMINSLKEMTTGDIDENSDEWLKLVDRGGLRHINDKLYAVVAITPFNSEQ